MYRVEVDWAPAYELIMSLQAYVNTADRKILELGDAWVKGVRERLSPDLAADLTALRRREKMPWLNLLVQECPGPRDAAGFLAWLDTLSAGAMYECMAPHVPEGDRLPDDIGALRDRIRHVLGAWNEQYFRHVDPAIVQGLSAEASATRERARTMEPEALVEQVSNGIHFVPQAGYSVIILIPQYHYRPWNVFDVYRDVCAIHYPADVLPAAPGEPPAGLLRLTGALADESRLRILRFLTAGPCSFTAIVQFTRLAKSTVHHHMVVLRAAGLVRVDARQPGGPADTYSLRPQALDMLDDLLRDFLDATRPV